MAITYFASASTPTDGAAATNVANPTAVTPPGSMVVGDLVVFFGQQRSNTAGIAISNTGGQTWTSEVQQNPFATIGYRMFWCRWNGTWSANPSITYGSAVCTTAVMHVFRPTTSTNTWSLDVAAAYSSAAGASNTGIGPSGSIAAATVGALAVAFGHTNDDNTLSITGTGWATAGSAQYRNTSGSDQSAAYAYKVFSSTTPEGAPTISVVTLGGDDIGHGLIFFKETVAGAGPTTRSLSLLGVG